jgi:hypothetical protein
MPVASALSLSKPVSRQSDAPSPTPDGKRLAHPERTHSALPARAGILFDHLQELFWDVLTAALFALVIVVIWGLAMSVALIAVAAR